MFKLSKESKTVFFALLIIPIFWIALNHSGFLDYMKVKSVDLRKQYRGEIPQDFEQNALDRVQVEDNKSVPRTPKLIYVNFDEGTMAMDKVGERPWDRAFFRDTCLNLFEKGGARAIGFDFGFTPKSMSRMVPMENVYRSDLALGELIQKYPNIQFLFVNGRGESVRVMEKIFKNQNLLDYDLQHLYELREL